MPTRVPTKQETIDNDQWFVIDATDQVLGRLATRVATLLTGKQKPMYAPFIVTGDHVIVINAAKVRLTGQKLDQKVYYRHTGYPGGLRQVTLARLLETRPEQVIHEAVMGMLPKNKLRKRYAGRLRVYRDGSHPHQAQQPQALEVNK
jgi:large subunit ribosomal protein L13